jgi:hypothetical protein
VGSEEPKAVSEAIFVDVGLQFTNKCKKNCRKYHVIFGHTARIWDCIIVDQYLVSVSEVMHTMDRC